MTDVSIIHLGVVMDLFTDTAAILKLIRFKEYYRMPRGHEHISFVFSSAFRDIFSQSFLRIRMLWEKRSLCRVWM